MNKMMAHCGLKCDECPVFLATQSDNEDQRQKVKEKWSRRFNMKLSVSDINCDGCKSDGGRLFAYCRNCEIKRCSKEKNLDNCAMCDEYACEKLSAFFLFVPHAQKSLEQIRNPD